MGWNIVLAPVNVLQHPVGVDGVRFFLEQFLQIRLRGIQLALLNLFARFRKQRMADPGDLFLNSFLRNLFEAGSPHSHRDQSAKNKTADVRPMGNAGRLSKHGPKKISHREPQREKPIGGSFEAVETVQHQPAHLDLDGWKSHQESAHQSGYGTRSADRRYKTSRVNQGMNL